jgi:hypothetical protein
VVAHRLKPLFFCIDVAFWSRHPLKKAMTPICTERHLAGCICNAKWHAVEVEVVAMAQPSKQDLAHCNVSSGC